jgi:hypothetical protein
VTPEQRLAALRRLAKSGMTLEEAKRRANLVMRSGTPARALLERWRPLFQRPGRGKD